MAGSTQATVAVATPAFAKRKARALIGWLSEEEGALWLGGRNAAAVTNAALLDRCRKARQSAAARPAGLDQSDIVSEIPAAAAAHVAALLATPWGSRIPSDIGIPALVDLTRVRAMQPTVHIEDAGKRVAGIDPADMAAIAAITLPIPPAEPTNLQPMFDSSKQAHIMASPSPNLRVMGPLSGIQVEIAPGLRVHAFGFAVALLPSFLSVTSIAGRYFLLDGYHRAYGLLAAGVTHAPALVRKCATQQEAGIPQGMLSPDVFLGDHPPVLPDYANDAVSVETMSPIVTKMVLIQALEVTPLG